MRKLIPSAKFDVSQVHQLRANRRDRRIKADFEAILKALDGVDAKDRPNLAFEIDVMRDEQNFRANWIAIATHLRHVPDIATTRGLELGSSVGTKLLIMQRLGATEIVGCDSSPHLISDGKSWIEQTGTKGITLVESSERTLPFDEASFDWVTLQMVYCQLNEDAVLPLIGEMHRVLKSGGVALVHDGANPWHEPTATAMRDYYRDVELGSGTAVEPAGTLFEMRKSFIASVDPGLTPPVVSDLARSTAYMRSEQIEAAVADFVDAGVMPVSPFDDEATNLRPPMALDGQAVRAPTDPFVMQQQFEAAGFGVEFQQSFLGGTIDDPQQYYRTDPSVFIVARRG